MKWKQTLEGFGLTEETVSQGIRNKIKDYYSIVDGIEELEKSIENPTLNDDVEEMESTLQDLKDVLEEQDKVLVKSVTMFDKNKEHYANLSKNLVGRGRPKKDAQPNVAQPTTQTNAQPNVQNVAGNVTQEEKPKKTNIALWIVGIVIGGLIGVNILKNRE
jgi:hypothetical protein